MVYVHRVVVLVLNLSIAGKPLKRQDLVDVLDSLWKVQIRRQLFNVVLVLDVVEFYLGAVQFELVGCFLPELSRYNVWETVWNLKPSENNTLHKHRPRQRNRINMLEFQFLLETVHNKALDIELQVQPLIGLDNPTRYSQMQGRFN